MFLGVSVNFGACLKHSPLNLFYKDLHVLHVFQHFGGAIFAYDYNNNSNNNSTFLYGAFTNDYDLRFIYDYDLGFIYDLPFLLRTIARD